MSDYRYAPAPDLWVQDDHVIAGEDMPDELKPDEPARADVQLVRDDAGQVTGAIVTEWDWREVVGPYTARWVPIA